ncbi:hypothetical protein B5E53_07605 [Eubacterium sp. An11]|nr:hypothetical protein B5E53_07605 [Eubacterium sp. An11]
MILPFFFLPYYNIHKADARAYCGFSGKKDPGMPPAYLPQGARSEGVFICAPLRSAGGSAFTRGAPRLKVVHS